MGRHQSYRGALPAGRGAQRTGVGVVALGVQPERLLGLVGLQRADVRDPGRRTGSRHPGHDRPPHRACSGGTGARCAMNRPGGARELAPPGLLDDDGPVRPACWPDGRPG
ncbi:protein of unknown function [Thauera humireducens]|nr:protein of unknown function [Thauera humireducens]